MFVEMKVGVTNIRIDWKRTAREKEMQKAPRSWNTLAVSWKS